MIVSSFCYMYMDVISVKRVLEWNHKTLCLAASLRSAVLLLSSDVKLFPVILYNYQRPALHRQLDTFSENRASLKP